MTDLKNRCQPPTTISGDVWVNTILSSEINERYVRDAKLALERNSSKKRPDRDSKGEMPEILMSWCTDQLEITVTNSGDPNIAFGEITEPSHGICVP